MPEILETLAKKTGVVLLYHGVFDHLPGDLDGSLHNVRPAILKEQLSHIGRFFEFVDVDTLAAMENPAGFAAVTFDDGYRCVLDEGLGVFESLGIPFTLYLNGGPFQGQPSWRDKIRFLESHELVSEFTEFAQGIETIPGKRFYRYSKMPCNDSSMVDAELDRFFVHKHIKLDLTRHLLSDPRDLVTHPRVYYGNHSQHHYVLASLSSQRVFDEIEQTRKLLNTLPQDRVSQWFSVPFGAEDDFDTAVAVMVRNAGYKGCLMSRYRLQGRPGRVHGIPAVERTMPRTDAADAGLSTLIRN